MSSLHPCYVSVPILVGLPVEWLRGVEGLRGVRRSNATVIR
jgi:hypothetical protein